MSEFELFNKIESNFVKRVSSWSPTKDFKLNQIIRGQAIEILDGEIKELKKNGIR